MTNSTLKVLLITMLFSLISVCASAQIAGTWKMSKQAAALGVGPALGDISWWSNSVGDLTTRACYFDDEFVFGEDGSFMNVMGTETWLEPWQGMDPEGCGTPIAPHDGSNAATWSYDTMSSTITISGVGAHLGLAKVINGSELTNSASAPASVAYPVSFNAGNDTMTINIEIANGGHWRFILAKEMDEEPNLDARFKGTWKMSMQAAALGVGPALGDISWWSNNEADVTTRACYFDDEYVFGTDGTFMNVLGTDTWLEPWQGMDPEGCGTPVAPHDNSNAATWSYDAANSSIVLTGTGAYLGLSKVFNGGELSDPANTPPASISYPVALNASEDTMTINIEIANGGHWRFILAKQEEMVDVSEQIKGTWKMSMQAAALGVGPALGDISWWSNSADDVTTRACYFDDEYVFGADGTFNNVLGTETWIEPWQGMDPEGCGTPVAPHNDSNAATWSYDAASSSITLMGTGAYIGLSKVFNGGELSDPANTPPASISYPVSLNAAGDTMTINIEIGGGGHWRFILAKEASTTSRPELVQDLFSFYPNPASTEIQIQSDRQIEKLLVRDISGRDVMVKLNVASQGKIDVASLPRGLYFLEVQSGNQRSIQKFILR